MVVDWLETNHSNVGAVAEAGFADDGEIWALPAVGLVVSQQPMRHGLGLG